MGVGGEHAAIMAAFLDLPHPHKWPRQFGNIERHLYKPLDKVKNQSQQAATNEEVAATISDEDRVIEQKYLQNGIYRIEASFDMGWQVRSSGGKYGSSTGHALLVGTRTKKVLDSVIFNKKCGICTKHEKRTGSIEKVRAHTCVKNYEGSSKAMEAAALVKMLQRMPEEKGVSICTIVSDDDSNARAKAKQENNGGLLPLTVEEPKFLADPSHRKRVFAKSIYNLANASAKVSTVSKGMAAHLKYCYGACVKRYRHLTPNELSEKVYNILEHISDTHEKCDKSWCYNKKAMEENKTYLAPNDHRLDKTKHTVAYDQLKKIFDQYANSAQMGYCNHPFDTQTNEAMNQAIATLAPKSICYSSTTSLNSRIALVVGIHNLGHLPFFTAYFDSIGVELGKTLTSFLQRKQKKREYKQTYQNKVSTKIRRSKQQQKTREDVFKEGLDRSYGSGIGLTAGMDRKRKRESKGKKTECCKCGSTTHKRTTHRDCPFKKRKAGPAELRNDPIIETPLQGDPTNAEAVTDIFEEAEKDAEECLSDNSERRRTIRQMVNLLSLQSFDDESTSSTTCATVAPCGTHLIENMER